ncbi:ExeM/NucH family extracellular endonuclease [Pseudidiomarina insulisalsae]|uniref:Nuclease n=1 Tax=Pseudidiomarina insulisalsae TaxID=575789 RepID=A0A432YM91_9GAMM|nr:ExeM/NucH family extracellular endonuclease [Pseudidiomarina insulisalsae]RUO62111.1 nuclease [Pseudidiomarina insulisalsae]
MHSSSLNKILNHTLILAASAALLAGCTPTQPTTTVAAACAQSSHSIAQVQGDAAVSPLLDQQVQVSGTVTASWQQPDQLGGFFLQGEQAALFVASDQTVAIGDRVTVSGTVSEANQLTQLVAISDLARCGTAPLPPSQPLHLPVAQLADFEALEGQRVTLPQRLVVNGTYALGRHGSFDVALQRLYTPTQVASPGAPARTLAASYELQRLVIDDNQAPNPAVVPYPSPALSASNTLRSGDQVHSVSGILSQFNGRYRIQPTQAPEFEALNPRPEAPLPVADARVIRIAAFNVLNYFNGEGAEQQFPTDRGAQTREAFLRQEEKIIAALSALNADVIGLMELENDGYTPTSAIVRLIEQLRLRTGADWQFIQAAEAEFGGASITNGLIYRADRVEPLGKVLTITSGPFSNRSRYPLVQRFRPHHSGESFAVAVNHFKSKGSCPRDANDPNANQNDVQACWNLARVQSAELLVQLMQTEPSLQQTDAQILLGDFNAYAKEDPMQVFKAAGYHNRAEHFEPDGYSYVYDAQAGSLDHVLVSGALHGRVLNQQHWLINADEPRALSYDNYASHPDWYAPSPYRASDHDPILIDLQF